MSANPWMKFYHGDFKAKTMGLTTEEVGALVDLMAWCHGAKRPFRPLIRGVSRLLGCRREKAKKLLAALSDLDLIEWDGEELWVPLLDEWRMRDARERVIPKDIANAVKQRDGECCAYCGDTGGPFDLDHIVPWSRGGLHTLENLTVACASCNRSKGARTPEEWTQ